MIVLNNDLIQKTDCYIDENHEAFSNLGERFFEVFGYDRRNNRISTQIRNLQQITCSATRFADIEDFVKNQMGKEQNERKWKKLGGDILKQLEELRSESQRLDTDTTPAKLARGPKCGEPQGEECAVRKQMALRLRLARGWVRAVVSGYLYQVAIDQMGDAR